MRLPPRVLAASVLLVACSDPIPPLSGTPPTRTPSFQRGVQFPWGGSATSSAIEIGLDVGFARNGAAAFIRSIVPTPPQGAFGAVAQQLSAVGYRGKRLRFSGFVQSDSVNGSGAGLWMRIDTPVRTAGFDNMISFGRGITGNTDWTRHSIVLDVPADAVGITFGMLLSGGGVVRLDDATLEVVDASAIVTGTTASDPSPRDSAAIANAFDRMAHAPENLDFEGAVPTFTLSSQWLKAVARPFTTDVPGSGTADLAELGTILAGARVAAFGEATHGTREFFTMKHRAFEYLVETLGYTHFLIEATMPEARAIDNYVTTGRGDPAKLLAGLYFWTWNTQEVLDLITWMRTYNLRAGTPRLRFVGFDMQSPHQAMDSLPAILGRVSQPARLQAEGALRCFDAVRANGQLETDRYSLLPDATKDACAAAMAALADTVNAHRGPWTAALGADDMAWLEQYLALARQWESMARMPDRTLSGYRRDRAMAENVLWVAGRNPQARLFVWAHNGHVSRRRNAMGRHLGEALGDQYRNVAFTFGGGRFNAVTLFANGTYGPNQVHQISATSAGSLEQLFNATLETRLILDARRVLTGETGTLALNRRPISMRSIGAVYSTEIAPALQEPVLLPLDYDGIIWFAGTRESRLLPFN